MGKNGYSRRNPGKGLRHPSSAVKGMTCVRQKHIAANFSSAAGRAPDHLICKAPSGWFRR
jgi:hypothetical protein